MMQNKRSQSRLTHLMILLAVWVSSSASVWAQEQMDLVFVVDGSRSIDAVDFGVEKDGLVAAVENPLLIPLDGTVAISVIQFATDSFRSDPDVTTRIEVPYTLIQDANDVASVSAQVAAMQQLIGGTNPR